MNPLNYHPPPSLLHKAKISVKHISYNTSIKGVAYVFTSRTVGKCLVKIIVGVPSRKV